jgi:hypothetical protein
VARDHCLRLRRVEVRGVRPVLPRGMPEPPLRRRVVVEVDITLDGVVEVILGACV